MIKTFYDIIVVVTNDLNSDQRMHRICDTYSDYGQNVLLLGHEKKESIRLLDQKFDQQRLKTLFQKGPLFYLEYNFKVLFLLLLSSCRTLYSVDLDTLLAIGLAAKLKRKDFIFDSHELFTELPELQGKRLKKKLWNLVGKIFIPQARYCITVAQRLSEVLSQKYKTDFSPIYNFPMMREVEETNLDTTQNVILYQGKINLKRGLEEIIQALKYMPEFELWIIGDGDFVKDIEHQVANGGSGGNIKLLGWKSPQQLKSITPKADLGINLLHRDSRNYYLSAANKVYDYIMAEIPCLTMNFPEYKRLNDEHDLLYLIDDLYPETIANAIQEIFANRMLYEQKKENCKKAKSVLNWEVESQKLLSLI